VVTGGGQCKRGEAEGRAKERETRGCVKKEGVNPQWRATLLCSRAVSRVYIILCFSRVGVFLPETRRGLRDRQAIVLGCSERGESR